MDRERLAWESVSRVATDAVGLVAAWALACAVRSFYPAFDATAHLLLGIVFFAAALVVLAARGEYRTARPVHLRMTRLSLDLGLAAFGLTFLLFVLDVEWVSRPVALAGAALAVPFILGVRQVRKAIVGAEVSRVVVVGTEQAARAFADRLAVRPDWGAQVVARVGDGAEPLANLTAVLRRFGASDVVCVGTPSTEELGVAAAACDELGTRLSLDASFLGSKAGRADIRELDGVTLVTFAPTPGRGVELAVKRAMDLTFAVILLVLTAPLLLVLMAWIRVQDPGPAIFSQDRVGRYGRPFRMYKLRTMKTGSEQERPRLDAANEADGPLFKLRRDPRVTPLGRWLRRSSLDELPQLVNVIRGDMSLVGPRPPLPDEVLRYTDGQRRRLSMRPGLTGAWQVSGRSTLPFDRAMELDLAYIDTWTLGQDLRLLIRTVPAVLSGNGAW